MSLFCNFLKMVILHDAIIIIENEIFVLIFEKIAKTCFFKKKNGFNKQVGCFLKNGFFSTLIIFQSFSAIFP